MGALLDRIRALSGNEINETYEKNASSWHRPLAADYELAELLGLEGCRREYLGAAALVDPTWREAEALTALSRWWGRDLKCLSAVEWIVSATHADSVRVLAQDQATNSARRNDS